MIKLLVQILKYAIYEGVCSKFASVNIINQTLDLLVAQ